MSLCNTIASSVYYVRRDVQRQRSLCVKHARKIQHIELMHPTSVFRAHSNASPINQSLEQPITSGNYEAS